MKFFVTVFALLFATILAFACNQKVTAVPVPGGFCNYLEITCPGGGCCGRDYDCGGIYPNCPKDLCCAGEDNGRLFGKPTGPHERLRTTLQRHPESK